MSDLLTRGRRGEPLADLGIIDMHGHLGRMPFGVDDASPDSLVAAMDRIGVRSIVCSHTHCMVAGPGNGNDEVLAAMRAHPGRILGYVVLWPDDPAAVRDTTLRFVEEGFVGIKLHNHTGFSYCDAAFAPALEIADRRRLPVLLHTWGREDELNQAVEIAGRHGGASFLLAHAGAYGSAATYGTLARDIENIHLELCLSASPRGHVRTLVELAGVDKVVWGSDALFLNMAQQIGKVLGAALSDEDKRAILSTNAKRILQHIGTTD